jgi:hypothetical protein
MITTTMVLTRLKYKKWIRERYPAGLVPILEKDGRVVYESSVCNDYLDEIYPEPKLTPSDPYEKAEDFSPGTPVSFNNKNDRHEVTEIVLKVALTLIAYNQ